MYFYDPFNESGHFILSIKMLQESIMLSAPNKPKRPHQNSVVALILFPFNLRRKLLEN